MFPITLYLIFVSAEDRIWLKHIHYQICFANNKSAWFTFYRLSLGKLAAIGWEYIHLLLPAAVHYHMKANAIDWSFFFWVDLI